MVHISITFYEKYWNVYGVLLLQLGSLCPIPARYLYSVERKRLIGIELSKSRLWQESGHLIQPHRFSICRLENPESSILCFATHWYEALCFFLSNKYGKGIKRVFHCWHLCSLKTTIWYYLILDCGQVCVCFKIKRFINFVCLKRYVYILYFIAPVMTSDGKLNQ